MVTFESPPGWDFVPDLPSAGGVPCLRGLQTRPADGGELCEAVLVERRGTRNVAGQVCIECHEVEKMVAISTDKAAVNPTNVMGRTKRLAEIYAVAGVADRTGSDAGQDQIRDDALRERAGSNGRSSRVLGEQIAKGGPVTPVTQRDITRFSS